MFKNLIFFILVFIVASCTTTSHKKKDTLFKSLTSNQTGIDFTNSVIDTKSMNIFSYRNFYNGAGVAIGDINNDGLPDIYFVSNMGKNKLYLNKGNLKFEDITLKSGTAGKHAWSTGVVMVDLNNDGYLDIYVSNAGNKKGDNRKNELFINNHDLTFTEKAADYNLDEDRFTTQTAFFDYDGDGDLDAYILNNSFIPVNSLNYVNKRNLRDKDWPLPDLFKGGGDKLLRNDNGKFVDVSKEANIYGSLIGFGLGVTIGDFNNDLLPDIYVCNDFYEHDYLYINQGDGTFKDQLENQFQHLTMSSMGADIADINNDGYQDLYVNDMLQEGDQRLKLLSDFESYDVHQLKLKRDFYYQYMQNTLQLNNKNNSFSEIAFLSNTAQTDWSWAALLFDMDNDGYKDIFVTNGLYHDLTNQDFLDYFANSIIQKMALTGKKEEIEAIINKMPSTPIQNYAFKNNGNLTFSNNSNIWGFDKKTFSNGAAYGDLDNDGDLDVVVNNVNQKALIYENQTSKKTKNNYLQVNLRGTGKNKFAIGSRVKLYYQKQIFDQECMPVRGFQSSVDYKLTFGLGKISTLDSLEIIWPNKKVEKVKNVKTNQKLTFFKKNASGIYVPSKKTIDKPYFTKEKNQPFLTHKEDRYNDFEFEGLVPEMLSKQGPAIAIADIDHNGLDDIFIGGAYNEPSRIYLQKKLGVFTQTNFSNETFFEDTAAVFADIDNDNDLDLIVGSGGNFKNARTGVRVYLNKGNGSFTDYKILAKIHANIATIKPYDYDNDGDIDLFVGSLSVPQVYGMNPKSLLLENNGKGNFKDVTFSKAKKLKNLGMITDAKWQDMDNDGIKDLIVIGKWMSPYIFKNNGNSLTEMKSNLSKISGDFTALNVADIDHDGDFDIILGNRGNNSFYKADSTHIAKMFVYDFDNNGSIEQIFTRTINQKDVPVHLLKELRAQLLSIKNKHYTFKSYATKSIDEIFSKETLNRALVKQINTFQSVVLINNNLNFTIKKLPIRAQMSTINSILVKDINNDGNLDLITAGNNYNYKTQYTRQDASYGDVYFGDGKGNFTWQPFEKTGFFIKGQINNMRFLNQNKPIKYLIVGPNNKKPQLFKINE